MDCHFYLQTKTAKRLSQGFTLIELMIVVVILGILTAIALPNYQEYVRRSRRVSVQEQMYQIQQLVQRRGSAQSTYAWIGTDPTWLQTRTGLATYPTNGDPAEYTLTIALNAAGNGFNITATRAGIMQNDACGDFVLSDVGQRTLVNNTAGMTLALCWRQ